MKISLPVFDNNKNVTTQYFDSEAIEGLSIRPFLDNKTSKETPNCCVMFNLLDPTKKDIFVALDPMQALDYLGKHIDRFKTPTT